MVYVDLLDDSSLRVITKGLRQALAAQWQIIWPSTSEIGAGIVRGGQVKLSPTLQPSPMLVPLDRLGAEQGKSGASVFVGYFMDMTGTYLPSRPLMIKIDKRAKLAIELENASTWPAHYAGEDSRFAYPFWLTGSDTTKASARSVLIAPFSSEGALDARQTGWRLKLHDLWQLLHLDREPTRNILKHLDGVYQLLHGVHRDGRVHCGRKLFEYRQEYLWYLRNLHTQLSSIPATLFGNDERTSMFGLTWPNPIQVLNRVLALPPIEGACGPVHGDLHPKNIVLDRQMQPSIIDFGWAQRQGHIVRDYVLMELNLRAMTLPSHIPFDALLSHAREFAPGMQPRFADAIIQDRSNLIRRGIWARMNQQGVVESWDLEYVVPLFMVAFGLLKHLDSARNQMALLLTVLGLAAYVTDTLDGQSKKSGSEVVLS